MSPFALDFDGAPGDVLADWFSSLDPVAGLGHRVAIRVVDGAGAALCAESDDDSEADS